MKRTLLFASLLLSAAASAPSRDNRASLLPKLHTGQTLTYLIRYRSSKNVKTESRVAVPLAPTASETDAHGLLRIEVLHLQPAGDRFAIRARGQFINDDFRCPAAKPAGERSKFEAAPLSPKGDPVEFTISPEGLAEKIIGFDGLTPEQQQIWQEWLARFALAWAIPSSHAKIGDKWKIERPEPTTSPIAALGWTRDSSYVRNEPCSPAQLSSTGEATFSTGPMDNCAVLLTIATLAQKSSPKDATPEDFKLHQLKTMGTAKGSNELITYISLTTGLVVRATEDATQQMDVVVAKADGSNGVHYTVDAKSNLEVLLLTEAQVPPQQ
jgi:hypothetical protein